MYILAQLVVKSYIPHILKKGMWFVRKHYPGTDKEFSEIFELDKLPDDKDEFLTSNGYPVHPYIIEEYLDGSTPAVLATPEQIGWFDEGEHVEDLRDITLRDINDVINYNEGFIEIDVDDETGESITINDKVIIRHAVEDEFEEYIMCNNCGSTDLEYNSSDQIICNNCGWEEDNNDM
jgi:hypothetical protein